MARSGSADGKLLRGLTQLEPGEKWLVKPKKLNEEGKPEKIVPKIVQGRLEAFFKDNCLVDQAFARDPSKSVGQVLRDAGAKVTQFVRVHVGA